MIFLENGCFIIFSVRYIEVIYPPEKDPGLCQTTYSKKKTVFLDLRTLRAANPKTDCHPNARAKIALATWTKHCDAATRLSRDEGC
jgi:hypothetical protein